MAGWNDRFSDVMKNFDEDLPAARELVVEYEQVLTEAMQAEERLREILDVLYS